MKEKLNRRYHAMCGNLLCGNRYDTNDDDKKCLLLDHIKEEFEETSVTLKKGRFKHLCFEVEDGGGVWFIGGTSISGKEVVESSELVSPNGTKIIKVDKQLEVWSDDYIIINNFNKFSCFLGVLVEFR